MKNGKFVPEGKRVMLMASEGSTLAYMPLIVSTDDGKGSGRTRVFQTLFSYGGWCWRALPYKGPKHNAVMEALEKRKVNHG